MIDTDVDLEKKEEQATKDGMSQDAVDKEFDSIVKAGLGDIGYNPGSGKKNGLVNKIQNIGRGGGKKKSRKGLIAVIGTMIMVPITSLFVSFFPSLEMIHIKEVFAQEVGGVSSTVYRRRSGKLFSRGFFFDDGGNFDGYKSRGTLFSVYDNYQTQNLTRDLKEVGFEVEYDAETGRVTRLRNPVSGEDITSSHTFENFWEKRGAIQQGLEEAYPTKSRVWRARQARKYYQRAGLSFALANYMQNNKLLQKIEDLEIDFRKRVGRKFNARERARLKLRNVFAGVLDDNDPSITIQTSGEEVKTGEDATDADKADADKLNDNLREAEGISDDIAKEADEFAGQVTTDPAPVRNYGTRWLGDALSDNPIRAQRAAAAAAKGASRGAIVGLGVNVADKVCRVKFLMDAVELGARTVRKDQLTQMAAMFAGDADRNKAGILSSEDLNGWMGQINSTDPAGRNFFGSPGYQAIEDGRTDLQATQESYDRYSTSGGSTGTLSAVNSLLNMGGALTSSCKVATNVGFQIGFGLAEAAITFAPCLTGVGCTITASKLAASAATGISIEVAYTAAEAAVRPLLVRMVAGQIFTGDEFGPEMGDALSSAFQAHFGRRSAFSGMRVLNRTRVAELQQEAEADKQTELANMSLYERYLDPYQHRSVAAKSFARMPVNFANAKYKLRSLLGSASTLGFAGNVGNSFMPRAYAQEEGLNDETFTVDESEFDPTPQTRAGECPDPIVKDKDIAVDMFCNPFYGMDIRLLDGIDPLDNIVWMIDNGYVERDIDSGNEPVPLGDYKDYIEDCFVAFDTMRNDKNEPKNKCMNSGPETDIMPNDTTEPIGKHDRFIMFRIDRDVTEGIAEDINRDFGTTQEVTTGTVSGATNIDGLTCPDSLEPHQSYPEYVRMPSAPNGEYNVYSPPARQYGSKELVCALHTVGLAYKAEMGNSSTLQIGDLNGGPPHVSHNDGVAVDVFASGDKWAGSGDGAYDEAATILLGKLFVDTGVAQNIWWCPPGSSVGQSTGDATYDQIRAYAENKGTPLQGFKCIKNHYDHFHVDILDEYTGPLHAP